MTGLATGLWHLADDAGAIELEIERRGVALGIDWEDVGAVRALARAAMDFGHSPQAFPVGELPDYERLAQIDLFGLAGVMLKIMQESADDGFLAHGGPAWKALAHALWAEYHARQIELLDELEP